VSCGTSLVAETGRRVGRKLNCIRGEFLESTARQQAQDLAVWYKSSGGEGSLAPGIQELLVCIHAIKYLCGSIPVRVERLGGCHAAL
jgi:hypothetical protein